MEQLINKKMQSVTVLETATRLGILNDELWNLFYESGAEFLDLLSMRVRRKRTFDAQFKSMLVYPFFCNMGFNEVMKQIRYSPLFWFWWGVQFWSTCHQIHFRTKQEFESSLQHIDNLIPHFILKRIFNGKQERKRKERVTELFNHQITQTGNKRNRAKQKVKG